MVVKGQGTRLFGGVGAALPATRGEVGPVCMAKEVYCRASSY